MTHRRRPAPFTRPLTICTVLVTGCWGGAAVASASGATWYASASGSGTACTSAAPCDLPTAVSQAAAGDTVLVTSGTYTLANALAISRAITVKGDPSAPRPTIVNGASVSADTIDASGGAVLDHLEIDSTATSGATTGPGYSALSIDGATAEDLLVSASASDGLGQAIDARDSVSGTTIRTVLVTSAAPGGSALAIKDSVNGAGTATLVNVTAVSTSSSTNAIQGTVNAGSVTIEDSIMTGQGTDIHTQSGTNPLKVSYSDFASTTAGAVAGGAGDISAAPVFAGSSDYHEAAGSPTIGSGAADSATTAKDLDGNAWASAPDMGAYQSSGIPGATANTANPVPGHTPAATGSTPAETGTTPSGQVIGRGRGRGNGGDELPPPSAPVAGVSVTLRPASGKVLVELPHTTTRIPLAQAAELPVGTTIDATLGAVTLTSAVSSSGATKTGTFHGGAFTVVQARGAHPVTTLKLTGGSFARACTVHGVRLVAGALARRPTRRVVRQLWGSDHGGRFVTTGRGASAAVRGTVWLTQDRCDGTLVKVMKGAVSVHDLRRHRTVVVPAGHSYLARVA